MLRRLRATGGRATTARRLILRSLFGSPHHRTAEDLTAEVQVEAPDVHISTVYRNLEELERLGVVTHVHLGHGPATYHLAPTTHCHLVCEGCGTVLEVGDQLFAVARNGRPSRSTGSRSTPTISPCADAAATAVGDRLRTDPAPPGHFLSG